MPNGSKCIEFILSVRVGGIGFTPNGKRCLGPTPSREAAVFDGGAMVRRPLRLRKIIKCCFELLLAFRESVLVENGKTKRSLPSVSRGVLGSASSAQVSACENLSVFGSKLHYLVKLKTN